MSSTRGILGGRTVIVTLAAWLYIIQALLTLGSLFSGPFGFGGTSALASLLVAGVFGAMGIGLLKREAWGRWLALGVSLLSWTLGSLMLVGLLLAAVLSGHTGEFFAMMFSSGALAVVGIILIFTVLIMAVSVVISFKLFFYLCSQEGCEAFGVPYGSAGTVAASVGAWIAIFVGQTFMASGGSGGLAMLLAQQALARQERNSAEVDPEQARAEQRQREFMRRLEEEQRHAEQEARLREIREAQAAPGADAAPEPDAVPTSEDAPPPRADYASAVEEARAPTLAPTQDEPVSANQVLKCRDASGAVTFTQGYCPPGTKRVDMTPSE
jgi:hypothetical protein